MIIILCSITVYAYVSLPFSAQRSKANLFFHLLWKQSVYTNALNKTIN